MKSLMLSCVALLALVFSATAQGEGQAASGWSLFASPTVAIPVFAGDGSAEPAFSAAWGGNLSGEYAFAAGKPLTLRLGAGYAVGGLRSLDGLAVPGSLNEALLFGGLGLGLKLSPALTLQGFADAGIVYGSLSTGTRGAYGEAKLGAGLELGLKGNLTARIGLDALYKFGLYGGVGASLGFGYALPARASPANPSRIRLLELSSISMKSVFPVLRSSYDTSPLGMATIVNTGKTAAQNVRVNFLIRQYMDAPKECAIIASIQPGKSIEVPLYALFNDRILDVTEATKVTGEVSLEYGVDASASRTTTVVVNDRSALTWDDDRKAAAFVSSKDPWVLDLSGNIMAAVKSARNAELSHNLQTAIAIHEGLRIYGIGYMLSTSRPFAQAVINTQVVDTLKFPRQTLGFRAGDCADLSVLYASCLEAAGVETAFVTIPGHIFLAVDLGLSREEAKFRAMDEGELIVQAGKAWVPMEVTMRDASFLEIWKTGASEYRDAMAKGTAAFFPVHEAWKVFAPMGLPADGSNVATPSHDRVVKDFKAVLAKAVDAELKARIAALGSIPKGLQAAKGLNSRGVLYAKYGYLADAEKDFSAAAKDGSVPALVNLGNLAMLKADPASALVNYQQAVALSPDNPRLLANLARAAAALGKGELVAKTLDTIKALDPKMAEQYSQLAQAATASGTRAAAVDKTSPIWF